MAFALGGKSGTSAEMNVTPMIDILLVLIIIFMIIQTHNRGEEALIPQPPTDQHDVLTPRTVVLELHTAESGTKLALNQQPIAWGELRERLLAIYKERAQRVLFIRADDALEFAPVADAIGLAHAAYPDIKVGLITTKIASGT